MIKKESTERYGIPKDSLSKFSDFALTIPFANMCSTMRQHMWHSHISQMIIPDNAERPYVDTPYTKSILFSSDNELIEGSVTLVDKIQKVINGFVCNTTYIYYDHQKGLYFVEKTGRYRKNAKYCNPVKSEFDEMSLGETKDNIYLNYVEAMDTRDGGIAFGRNVPIIYDIDENVGEDSIVICEELANMFTVHPYYDPVVTYNPKEELLLDRYGFIDQNGITHYKPFPLPGEDVQNGEVAVVSKVAKDFLASSDDLVHNSDVSYYIFGGTVTDVEVYSNYTIDNPFLENLRQIHMDYFRNIIVALNKLPYNQLSLQAKSMLSKLSSITTSSLRFGTEELKKLIKIKLEIVGNEPLAKGSKLTNRYGGKGTVSKIIKNPLVTKSGKKALGKFNASGILNRENIPQQMEISLSTMNMYLMEYLINSNDSIEVKYNNIIKWLTIIRQYEQIDFFKASTPELIVNYVKDHFLYLKFDPFDNAINKVMLYDLTKFQLTLTPNMAAEEVFEEGVVLGSKFFIGNVFLVRLENDYRKDSSMRSDQINSSKGGLSRVGLDKKKYHSKYLTTAAKQSDLAQNVTITSQFDSDTELFTPDLSQLEQSLNAIGITMGLEDIPESED